VIREDEVPQVNQAYQSEHHRLIAITPLAGAAYEEDNGKVFDLLKSWTINGPAWTWMRAHNVTRNGRQALRALVNHFEGDAQRDRVKDAAYASIAAARYYGEKKKFTFETYVSIHQDAYADLEQCGEIISEEKCVGDYSPILRIPLPQLMPPKVLYWRHHTCAPTSPMLSHIFNNFTVGSIARYKKYIVIEYYWRWQRWTR
jgi:hypothetical protein